MVWAADYVTVDGLPVVSSEIAELLRERGRHDPHLSVVGVDSAAPHQVRAVDHQALFG